MTAVEIPRFARNDRVQVGMTGCGLVFDQVLRCHSEPLFGEESL
jgi:hypothetical protein